MDLTLTSSAKTINLKVVGNKADGAPATIGTPSFTVESGSATLTPGPDVNSQVIDADNTLTNSSIVRVDVNADLQGGSRILTARLFLTSVPPAVIPTDEAVDLVLTAE